MGLNDSLVKEFAKAINSSNKAEKSNASMTAYGTAFIKDGKKYVQIDGSELLTPISSTADLKDGERVTVTVKDHTVMVTGNLSSPSARIGTVIDINNTVNQQGNTITQINNSITQQGNTITQQNNTIKEINNSITTINSALNTQSSSIDTINSNIKTMNSTLSTHGSDITTINSTISTHDSAINTINSSVKVYNSSFQITNGVVTGIKGIKNEWIKTEDLEADHAAIESLDTKYANIDFSNITKANFESFYAKSGMVQYQTNEDLTVTGHLVGVVISGDLIEGNTIKAEKLLVKGEDGLYYKLNVEGGATTSELVTEEDLQNGLAGSIIIAKSITADKVSVSDLVAFGAKIADFTITDDSIYSGVKETVNNTTRGIYMDNDGQMAVGDASNYLKYYKDQNGEYKLEISAKTIILGSSGKDIETTIKDLGSVEVGARNLIRNSSNMIFENYYFDEKYKSTQAVLAIGVIGHIILGTEG